MAATDVTPPTSADLYYAEALKRLQEQGRWNSPSNLLQYGITGLNAFQGLQQGQASGRNEKLATAQAQMEQLMARYRAMAGARSGQADLLGAMQGRDMAGRKALLDSSPLGAEQMYAARMAANRGLSEAAGSFRPLMPTSGDISRLVGSSPNLLGGVTSADYRKAVSADATSVALAERRKAQAGMDPNFQFGSMSAYGVPDRNSDVNAYQTSVRQRMADTDSQLKELLKQQMTEATALPSQLPGVPSAMDMAGDMAGTGAAAQPKKTPWWKKAVGAALPIAAAFIPGVGPMASIALQAAAGAAGGALTGGKKGALTGAILGGIGAKTGGLGSATGQRVAGETAGAFAKRAVLSPSVIATTAGKVLPGQIGQAAQTIAPFLRGPQAAMQGPIGPPMPASIAALEDFKQTNPEYFRVQPVLPGAASRDFIPKGMTNPGMDQVFKYWLSQQAADAEARNLGSNLPSRSLIPGALARLPGMYIGGTPYVPPPVMPPPPRKGPTKSIRGTDIKRNGVSIR